MFKILKNFFDFCTAEDRRKFYLSIFLRNGNAWARPVLCINEVCTLECLLLIVFDSCALGELWIKLIAFWMSNNKINIWCCKHPLSERVWHSLWKTTAMRSPCEDSLYTLCCLMFFYCNKVGECLKRVNGCSLHCEDRLTSILYELVYDGLGIVVFTICEACERAYTDKVAEATHYRDCLKEML